MLYEQIQEAVVFLRTKVADFEPELALILGTGLGKFTAEIDVFAEINYADIPHFGISTVEGHAGKLLFGHLQGRRIVAMSGRLHYYEGYTMQQVTFPTRVMRALGAHTLIASAAVGSLNTNIQGGDLVFVRDHINLQPENPLRGPNDARLGVRFPDMNACYDDNLNQIALDYARANHIRAHKGIYVSVQGPSLETPSETDYLHRIGADVVGMSVVPEVLVAKHGGMKVFVVAIVSNNANESTTLEFILASVEAAASKLATVVKAMMPHF